jgi:polysaccharide biosynthesis transport protein
MDEALPCIIWRERWTAVIVVVACVAGGLLYLRNAPRYYTSTATVHIQQSGPVVLGDSQLGGVSTKHYLHTQAALIRSTPILAVAVERTDFSALKTFEGSASYLDTLRAGLFAWPQENEETIYVGYIGPHADEVAVITNAIVDAYVAYQSRQRQNTASEVVAILRRERERHEEEIAKKRRQLQDLKQADGAFWFDRDRQNIHMQRLQRLSDALTVAHVEAVTARTAFEQAVASLGPLRETEFALVLPPMAAGDERRLRDDLSRWQQHLFDLERRYSVNHPTVRATQAKVDELGRAFLVSLRHRMEAAESTQAQLQTSFDEQYALAMQLDVRTAEHASLAAEIARLQHSNDAVVSRIHELSVAENAGVLNIHVWEYGFVPNRPSTPIPSRVLGLSLLLGLAFGSGGALLRSRRRGGSGGQPATRTFGLPVIGVIPRFDAALPSGSAGQKVLDSPHSSVAEAFRTLGATLFFAGAGGALKTLLVTSPASGEGKTTVASNLAIVLAQLGRRVLLLDADYCNPMQHRVFDLAGDRGLATVLTGAESLEKSVRKSRVEGLEILPAGPAPSVPSALLSGSQVSDFLQDLTARYDHVIIDAPSVGPEHDARLFAPICDGTILVLDAVRTDRHAIEKAQAALEQAGAALVGVVLTGAPHQNGAVPPEKKRSRPGHRENAPRSDVLLEILRTNLDMVRSMKEQSNGNTSNRVTDMTPWNEDGISREKPVETLGR